MVKRALLVGCNYPGTKCELKGCVNDVDRMRILLVKRFGFDNDQILQLVDTDSHARQPTGANIRQCLKKLIDGVQPGDVLFFHFSGHGTQVPPEDGMPDDTGYEECIVPTDMNLLSDDDFRELVDRIPPGVNFTFIADSCHSGGLIDSEKEQIGDSYSSGGGGGLLSGGRPQLRPEGRPGRPPAGGGDGGLMGLVSEGIEAYSGAGGGGKKNPLMGLVGQALGSRFNKRDLPGDQKDREFDPQDIDAYGRQPESPYERGYVEGGSGYPPERSYERRDAREPDIGYEAQGSGYPPERTYARREVRGPERGYADRGSGYAYDEKYMRSARSGPETGYAGQGTGYIYDVKYMRPGPSEPETGYAEKAFGYPLERPGGPYEGSYPSEEAYGRPAEGAYDYPPGQGAYERPGRRPVEDGYGYPPREAYERPGRRPMDDEYGYPPGAGYENPTRRTDDEYDYPPRGAYGRPEDGDYRHSSEGAYRRPEEGSYGYPPEGAYGRPEEDSHDRYGERRHGYDPREEERPKHEREEHGRDHNRRENYGEGSSGYDASSRYPAKYPSEYAESGGNYGVHPESGEIYNEYPESGRHGYSGKPHHTPLQNKSLDIQTLTQILSERTGQSVNLGNIRKRLYDIFGEEASPTVKFFVNVVLNKLQESGVSGGGGGYGLLGKIGGLASQLLKTKLTDYGSNSATAGGGYGNQGGGSYGGGYGDYGGGGYGDHGGGQGANFLSSIQDGFSGNKPGRRRIYDSGILISACQPDESSADANPTGNPRNAYGALSNAIQTIIGESRGPHTNRQVVMAARKLLSQQGYKQHPCLYCNDRNADGVFLDRLR